MSSSFFNVKILVDRFNTLFLEPTLVSQATQGLFVDLFHILSKVSNNIYAMPSSPKYMLLLWKNSEKAYWVLLTGCTSTLRLCHTIHYYTRTATPLKIRGCATRWARQGHRSSSRHPHPWSGSLTTERRGCAAGWPRSTRRVNGSATPWTLLCSRIVLAASGVQTRRARTAKNTTAVPAIVLDDDISALTTTISSREQRNEDSYIFPFPWRAILGLGNLISVVQFKLRLEDPKICRVPIMVRYPNKYAHQSISKVSRLAMYTQMYSTQDARYRAGPGAHAEERELLGNTTRYGSWCAPRASINQF